MCAIKEQAYAILASWAAFTCMSGLKRKFSPFLCSSIYAHANNQGEKAINKLDVICTHRIVSQVHAIILGLFAL